VRNSLHGFSALWWLVGLGFLPLEEHPPTVVEIASGVGVHVAGQPSKRIGLYAGPWVWFLGREPWNVIARAVEARDRQLGTFRRNAESSELPGFVQQCSAVRP
jgi:hypothetical protein